MHIYIYIITIKSHVQYQTGKPTAAIDWCEINYEVSPYVVEWWNTLSSMNLWLAGLIGKLCIFAFIHLKDFFFFETRSQMYLNKL